MSNKKSDNEHSLTAIDKYETIQKIGTKIEVPHSVWTKFGCQQRTIEIAGADISLGEDYGSLAECRAAIQWYAKQLGGTVEWRGPADTKKPSKEC